MSKCIDKKPRPFINILAPQFCTIYEYHLPFTIYLQNNEKFIVICWVWQLQEVGEILKRQIILSL